MPAPARFFLPVSVLMPMRVPVPVCLRVRVLGAAYIQAFWGSQDPVSGVACARLEPRGPALEFLGTCCVASSCAPLQSFLETYCMASLHFGSPCCRAQRMSLNGCLRNDSRVSLYGCLRSGSRVWRLSGRFLETACLASLHFSLLCRRGCLRSDRVLANASAGAFLPSCP